MGDLNSAIQVATGHHDFAATDALDSQGVETVKVAKAVITSRAATAMYPN